MSLKTGGMAFVMLTAAIGSTHAQTPSVAAAWGEMDQSQQGCLDRGVAVFNRLNFKRVEAIGFSVYGDFGKFQIAIRCIPDKKIYVVYGGGPGDDEKPLLAHINAVKKELDTNR